MLVRTDAVCSCIINWLAILALLASRSKQSKASSLADQFDLFGGLFCAEVLY